jgi:hypothetical protein
MSKLKNKQLENITLNADMRSHALYDIWQLLALIDINELNQKNSAIISCAMARACEAGSLDFNE